MGMCRQARLFGKWSTELPLPVLHMRLTSQVIMASNEPLVPYMQGTVDKLHQQQQRVSQTWWLMARTKVKMLLHRTTKAMAVARPPST